MKVMLEVFLSLAGLPKTINTLLGLEIIYSNINSRINVTTKIFINLKYLVNDTLLMPC